MAPRIQHSEREVDELVKLITEYKVQFLPPVTDDHLESWQLPYKDVFEQVTEIQKVTFKNYPPINHFDKAEASRKKLLVREIQANAAQCSREQENEAGWINNVANPILRRLNGFEFVCQRCKKYLWIPDFLALPADPTKAEELRRRHHRRTLCECGDAERASAIGPNQERLSIFSNKSDERVLHRDVGLQSIVIDQKYKRPDRVFGLRLTDSFVSYFKRQKEFSPFKNGFTLYPFLIVEAKSEKRGPGFDSIQRQSALAIRTCLKLQVELESQSREILRPKVWFLGFQGAEWRLYCAIPRGDGTSVIDCWHGYMQDASKVLQLLLIIDWICCWARDVYRPAVLRCLTQGSPEPRGMTPAETSYSSQGDGTGYMGDLCPRKLAYRSSRQSSMPSEISAEIDSVHMSSEVDDAMDILPIGAGEDQSNQQGNLGQTTQQKAATPSVVYKKVAARLEKRRHLEIPDTLAALKAFLDVLLPVKTQKEAASKLLDVLLHNANRAIVSLLALSNLVGHSDDQSGFSDIPGEEPVLILFTCQNWFNPPDWQIVRTFTCISCTQEAARQLAILAERIDIIHTLCFWRAHDCNCLLSAVSQFELLEVRQSVQAAWSRDIFCVIAGTNGAEGKHLGWSLCAANASRAHIDNLQSILANVWDRGNTRFMELPHLQADVAPFFRQLIDTTKLNDVPGVLIKRPRSWSEDCDPWCYLIFEQQCDGSAVESTGAAGKVVIYAEEGLSTEDEAFLRAWSSPSAQQEPNANHLY